jgi:hypothetical protein
MLINSISDKTELLEFKDIKKNLLKASNEAMDKSRKITAEKCRVTSLNERMNSPLM